MRGDLTASFSKGGREQTRTLEPDRSFTKPDGGECTLSGRSLLAWQLLRLQVNHQYSKT